MGLLGLVLMSSMSAFGAELLGQLRSLGEGAIRVAVGVGLKYGQGEEKE